MANTRQSAKRARRSKKQETANTIMRSGAKSAIKKAITAIQNKDVALAKEAYQTAVKTLSHAASKGVLPKTRVSRKISRLTQLAKKYLPSSLPFKS